MTITAELEAKLAAAGSLSGYVSQFGDAFYAVWIDKGKDGARQGTSSQGRYHRIGSTRVSTWEDGADLVERYTGSRPKRRAAKVAAAEPVGCTLGELRALAIERSRPRKRKRAGKRGHKTVRCGTVRDYAVARARQSGGLCEACGIEWPWPYDVHHVREDELCDAKGIDWDSPFNVLAICPNCHRREKHDREFHEWLFVVVDAMEHLYGIVAPVG